MSRNNDIAFLQMAYALARKAKGWASPNPSVGALITKNHAIVGFGYHKRPGQAHAEAVALQMAGTKSKGGTAYVTLEPCVHWGRTPPCVNSLIQAGLKKIVISDLDPNPLVFGKGIKKLKASGVEVSQGLLADQNRILNEAYAKYIVYKIPFVLVKAAISLDGKLATRCGRSRWISSRASRQYTHLIRGEYDAIMVGVNTVIQDDPLLTVRHPNWRGKTIARVVLDSKLRFPKKARMLDTLDKGRILIFTLKSSSSKKSEALQKRGAEVVFLPGHFKTVEPEAVLKILGRREISSLLVEGGGRVITSLMDKRLVDKISLTISPKLIGGLGAPSLFQGEGVRHMEEALRLKRSRCFGIEDDVILEGYF